MILSNVRGHCRATAIQGNALFEHCNDYTALFQPDIMMRQYVHFTGIQTPLTLHLIRITIIGSANILHAQAIRCI